jgi:hypothetical protein
MSGYLINWRTHAVMPQEAWQRAHGVEKVKEMKTNTELVEFNITDVEWIIRDGKHYATCPACGADAKYIQKNPEIKSGDERTFCKECSVWFDIRVREEQT